MSQNKEMANFTIQLKERRKIAVGTELFVFEKPADFTYEAGQYIAMVLKKSLVVPDARGAVRSFSFSSAPCEKDLYFAMREGVSGFKQTMFTLEAGDSVTITKAIGHFTLNHASDGKPIVFLAGGIGITPVRSILKQAEHDGNKRDFTLIYSNRFERDAAFHEELKNLSLENFHYVTTLSQETAACSNPNEERGYICEEMVRRHVKDISEAWYYLVGAPAFIEAMEKMLTDMGIPKERQVLDPFTGMARPDDKKKETVAEKGS